MPNPKTISYKTTSTIQAAKMVNAASRIVNKTGRAFKTRAVRDLNRALSGCKFCGASRRLHEAKYAVEDEVYL